MNASSRVHIGKVSVDRMSLGDMLRRVAAALRTHGPITVFYANSHAVTLAEADPSFAAAMEQADAIFCDGFGVYVASRVLGGSIPERFSWPDWIQNLCEVSRDAGAPMFFLGANEGVAAEAGRKLAAAVPGLKVSSHHGHFDKDDASSRSVIDLVNRSGAQVLLVGFGMPLQELWIARYRAELKALVVFSVGALLDYAAGNVARGPRWLTGSGFEWMTRLVIEPRRLWRRYLIGLPEFGLLVLRQRLASRPQLSADNR